MYAACVFVCVAVYISASHCHYSTYLCGLIDVCVYDDMGYICICDIGWTYSPDLCER